MNKRINLRTKLLVLILLPLILISTGSLIYMSIKFKEDGINALKDKSTAILSRMEAVRGFVATQGMLETTMKQIIEASPNGNLSKSDHEKIMNQVPIIASMKVGAENANEENYEFRVASLNARNPENVAVGYEKDIIKQFMDGNQKTIVYEDQKSQNLEEMLIFETYKLIVRFIRG